MTDGTNSLTGISALDALNRINTAINKIPAAEGKPEQVRAATVKIAKQGGLVIEMSNTEGKDWLT